jgi:HAD superfamily hydrolase (TIGR01509 family)
MLMKLPKLFIFDMDGTMFDTEPISYMSWRNICKHYGYDFLQEDFYKILGQDNHRAAALFTSVFGSDFPYEKIAREKVAYQLAYYKTHDIPVKPGLQELLGFARSKGSMCAVASSSPQSLIEYLLAKQGLTAYYQIVQSGEDVLHGKPAPDIFLTVCQKAGVTPEASLVLEDSASGIQASQAAHIPSVWIRDMVDIPAEVARLAWRKCKSLSEVSSMWEGEQNQ